MFRIAWVAVVIFTVFFVPCQAQVATAPDFKTIKIEDWKGQRFVFLPMEKDRQKRGYSDLTSGSDLSGATPAYSELVGKSATVMEVAPGRPGEYKSWIVKFRLDGSIKTYTANPRVFHDGDLPRIDNIALLDGINGARRRWRGKALWVNATSLDTYDERTGKAGELKIPRFAKVQVINAVPSWDTFAPVRLLLRTESGGDAYWDLAVSGTNRWNLKFPQFSDHFLTEDPRKTHDWPEPVWAAIGDGKVIEGMTPEQVRMTIWPGMLKAETSGDIWNLATYTSSTRVEFANGLVKQVRIEPKKDGEEDPDIKDIRERTKDAARRTKPVGLMFIGKFFRKMDLQAGDAGDQITFSFILSNDTNKNIRAIRGALVFSDLFDKPIMSVAVTYDKPLNANGGRESCDFALTYNQFMDDHRKLKATDLGSLVTRWVPSEVIYADGTTETVKKIK